jgi:hypothetical protein
MFLPSGPLAQSTQSARQQFSIFAGATAQRQAQSRHIKAEVPQPLRQRCWPSYRSTLPETTCRDTWGSRCNSLFAGWKDSRCLRKLRICCTRHSGVLLILRQARCKKQVAFLPRSQHATWSSGSCLPYGRNPCCTNLRTRLENKNPG